MIALTFSNINELTTLHYEAVKSYVENTMREASKKSFHSSVLALSGMEDLSETDDTDTWLKRFILASPMQLDKWASKEKDKLSFTEMKSLYLNRFSNSPTSFVDPEGKYNAYTLFTKMGIKVCPYCEHEFIDIIQKDGKERRTMEFDHFYPKGDDEYPGLAMCFFNLIPSCKPCNQLKLTSPTEASPYDPTIETLTWIYPDLELGVNMEDVSVAQCKPLLHPTGGMVVNNITLGLEQKYANLAPEVHRLLKNKQQFSEEKLKEMEAMGFGKIDDLRRGFFGTPKDEARWHELHTKMKYDLIGY